MNLSFEKLQELIIEETIKLLNEQPVVYTDRGKYTRDKNRKNNDGGGDKRKTRMSRAEKHLKLFKKYLPGNMYGAYKAMRKLKQFSREAERKGESKRNPSALREMYNRAYVTFTTIIDSFLSAIAEQPKLGDNGKISNYPKLDHAWLLYKYLYTREGSIPLLDQIRREIEKDSYPRKEVTKAYNTVVRRLGELEKFEQETDRELKQREEEPKEQVLDPDTAVATTGPVVPPAPAPAPAKELTSDEVYDNAIDELTLLTGLGGQNQVRNYKEIQKLLKKINSHIRREEAKGLSLDEQTSQSDSLGKLRALRKKLETLLSKAEITTDDEGKEIKKISADAIAASVPFDGDDDLKIDPIDVEGIERQKRRAKTKRRRRGSLARKPKKPNFNYSKRVQQNILKRGKLKLKSGEPVSLKDIQGVVGARRTGIYDRETFDKIIAYQQKVFPNKPDEHDGIFGSRSLKAFRNLNVGDVEKVKTKLTGDEKLPSETPETLKVGNKEITSKAEFERLAKDILKYRAELEDSIKNNKPMQAVQGLYYNINDIAKVDKELKKKYGRFGITHAYEKLFGPREYK